MSDVGSARRAKDELKAAIGGEPWCAGIGVEREDGVASSCASASGAGSGPEQTSPHPRRIGDVVVKVEENDA